MCIRLRILLLFLISLLIWQNARAQAPETRELLIQRSFEQLQSGQFDDGLATCAKLRRNWPDDPAGYLLAANIYQTMMRDYRVRLFEAKFDSLIKSAVQLADKQVSKHATPEMLFMLGTSRGYRGLHRFRCGEWGAGFRDAVLSLHAMERALRMDPGFADPGLALALYEYWKSAKLDFGLGMLKHKRTAAIAALEDIRRRGRYLAIDATYALQTIRVHEKDYAAALEINSWLYERFPQNISTLYHRGLILEKLDRPAEALAAWDTLVQRLHDFSPVSDGFLAECHLHRAQLNERLKQLASTEPENEHVLVALQSAHTHAQQRRAAVELEGPLASFDDINKAIKQMVKKYATAGEILDN